MKHALLVEVPEWDAAAGLRSSATLSTMASLLGELGGWSIVECKGSAATRDGVLAALERLIGTCGPSDACLFHFFGHGRMARFPALGDDRPRLYLATLAPPEAPVAGVLDFEVSAALTRLDAICGNVTAIIDCCRSGSMVRNGPLEPPAWPSALAERARDPAHRLATESHPRIVRLGAASSQRTAYTWLGPQGPCGLLTQGFVDVVREAGLRCDRLTWDAVAHRIRERASRARGTEEQRVVLAGPRQRLVFSTATARLPRSAAYVPRREQDGGPRRGWLRAGALQGVRVGDRWSLAALTLDDQLEPRFVADLEVERVELDLAEVSLTGDVGDATEPLVGASALLREVEARVPIAVEGANERSEANDRLAASAVERAPSPIVPTELLAAIEASAWVRVAPREVAPRERVAVHGSPPSLVLLDADGRPAWCSASASPDPTRDLVDLLDDRARAARLLAALASLDRAATPDVPLRLRWGTVGADGRPRAAPSPARPDARPRLRAGDRLWLELVHEGATPPHWFASVIAIEPDGRPRLLNAREPEGLELAPSSAACIGLRGGGAREGLPLPWPAGVPQGEAAPRPLTLVVLASQRPLPLGHLVRPPDPDDDAAFVTEGLPSPLRGRARGGPAPAAAPEASRGFTWHTVELELDPPAITLAHRAK